MPTIRTQAVRRFTTRTGEQASPQCSGHGWPLTGEDGSGAVFKLHHYRDDWDEQMLFFGQQGHRVIAHDRRGHGRSDQTWDGNEMNTGADDLAALTKKLDLEDAIHVGHSTGGGEVNRYIGRHGTKRVAMVAAPERRVVYLDRLGQRRRLHAGWKIRPALHTEARPHLNGLHTDFSSLGLHQF
jgi:non-heme chloroperoxidase